MNVGEQDPISFLHPFPFPFFVFPFFFCCSITQRFRRVSPHPILLIHWKDSSHVISTFNLTNEASWLELIAFPQGHNSICNVHDQSPRALVSGSRQGAIEDQKTSPFIFRACSKQIRWSSRSCQSYKEPQSCNGHDSEKWPRPPYGWRISEWSEVSVRLKELSSMWQCPSTSYLLFYNSLFPKQRQSTWLRYTMC